MYNSTASPIRKMRTSEMDTGMTGKPTQVSEKVQLNSSRAIFKVECEHYRCLLEKQESAGDVLEEFQ